MKPAPDIHFTADDFSTALWHRLKQRCEERIAKLHKSNEANLTDEETARIRGRIAELRDLLKIEDLDRLPKIHAGKRTKDHPFGMKG